MARKFLIAYDGSEESVRALELAIELQEQKGPTEFHLAYVVEKPIDIADPVLWAWMRPISIRTDGSIFSSRMSIMKCSRSITTTRTKRSPTLPPPAQSARRQCS